MFIEAYEIWVTKLRQDYLARQSAVRLTDEQDCLSWPTPKTPIGGPESRQSRAKRDSGGEDLAATIRQWPTPQYSEYKGMGQRGLFSPTDRLTNLIGLLDRDKNNTNGKNQDVLWRTPQVQEPGIKRERLKGKNGHRMYNRESGRLAQYALTQQIKGRLNPDWVEQLVGLPVGWTDLGFWVTVLCPHVRKRHLET
jgi:hypothetical protein